METQIQIQDTDLEKTINILKMRFDNPKITITELCEEMGLSRMQYYRKLEEGQEIIELLRKLILKSKRVELAHIASSRHQVLHNLISQALGSDDIDELVKALKYLDEHEEQLQDDLGAKPGLEDEARAFLKRGPKIAKQKSKFASIRVSEESDGSMKVDVYKEHDVIEGELEEI